LGLCCLIAGLTLIFVIADGMYMAEALVYSVQVEYPPDFVVQVMHFHNWTVAALILLWLSICCVKFSFLVLFKRLIRQMPRLIQYWWFVVIFNVLCALYGAAVYIAACPYFGDDALYTSSKLLSVI
jgi:hypothetical protein